MSLCTSLAVISILYYLFSFMFTFCACLCLVMCRIAYTREDEGPKRVERLSVSDLVPPSLESET
jgi:hypothetical protein